MVQSNYADIVLTLDFPVDTLEEITVLPEFGKAFDVLPSKAYKGSITINIITIIITFTIIFILVIQVKQIIC